VADSRTDLYIDASHSTKEFKMTDQTKITRRRFLMVAGGAIGASALCCGGLATLGPRQMAVEFAESSCRQEKEMDNRILVAYASKCGSTGGVAEAIGQVLCDAGAAVDVRKVQDVKDIGPYQAIVIGSAVRMARVLPPALKFAKRHRASLSQIPAAYFTACLAMKDDTPENRETAAAYLDPLCQIKEPTSVGLFGGKLDYSTLAPIFRLALSRDQSGQMAEGDYRDWNAIRAWAGELVPVLIGP
jgi:menaquinone-dependent protoporphyrinogen oxidase